MIVATDAPLTARQLGRIARRSFLGLARTGGYGYNRSGDIALSFSTAQRIPHEGKTLSLTVLPDTVLNPLFKATAEAVEEAIINSLLEATTLDGRDDHILYALPPDDLKKLLAD
jgi:D-aminopeptidase